ncbi:MAG: SRPBCC family protein, partial [Chloroflexi bacterium]|nr:SRPBCC family protein [Chloroflexota bacterium]
MPNTTYEIVMSRRLKQSSVKAFKVVEDLERFPEFMPNVNSLTLLEEDGNRKVAAWD